MEKYVSQWYWDTDWKGNKYGFEWIVSKVEDDSEFKNCWMTSGVSQPLPMAKGV